MVDHISSTCGVFTSFGVSIRMVIVIICVSLSATLIGAISGIGGGVIIKPVLDALGLYATETVNFLSGTTVLAMATVSLLQSRNTSIRVQTGIAAPLALGGVIGGATGKQAFSLLQETNMRDSLIGMTQNIILMFLTVAVFIYVLNKGKLSTLRIRNKGVSLFAGVILGTFSSFLGIGGGPINIMVLSLLFSMNTKEAAINSLYVIFFSQFSTLALNLIQGTIPQFNVFILMIMIISGMVGALLGRWCSQKLMNAHIDRLFLGVMILIMGLSVSNIVRFA